MKQMTLAEAKGFEKHSRASRKAGLLARMESLMRWAEFCALIQPHFPKAGNGLAPVDPGRMLRMYCVANWFNLADEACEVALYDVAVFCEFCPIDLGCERLPDATTLLNFRHMLEVHQPGTGRHRQEAPQSRRLPLHFATHIVSHPFRDDVLAVSLFGRRLQFGQHHH